MKQKSKLEEIAQQPISSHSEKHFVEVPREGVKEKTEQTYNHRLKYQKEELELILEKEDLFNKPLEELYRAFAHTNYDWSSSFCTLYGNKTNDWYGALENYGFSKQQITKIKKSADKIRIQKLKDSTLKYSKKKLESILKNEPLQEKPLEELSQSYAKKHYGWYSSFCTLYGNKTSDWYGALENIGFDVEKIKEIRNVVKENHKKLTFKYTKEEIDQILTDLDFLNKPLEELYSAFAHTNYDWSSSFCTLYGKNNNDWYGALENIGFDVEKIKEIKNFAIKNRRVLQLKYSKEELDLIIRELDFFNLPLEELTKIYAKKNYDWMSSFSTLYGKNGSDWYGALENIGIDVEKIKEKSRFKYTKRELDKILIDLDFLNKPLEELTLTHARKNYVWFNSFCKIFGNKSVDWYGALENIGFSVAKIKKIRNVLKENIKKPYLLKYSKKELDQILIDLDFLNKPLEELTCSYAQTNYDWMSSLGTLYGKNGGDWYYALEKIGFSVEKIKEIKNIAIENRRGRQLKYSKKELEQILIKEDLLNKPLENLTSSYARKNYDWYSSFCTLYGNKTSNWHSALCNFYLKINENADNTLVDIFRENMHFDDFDYENITDLVNLPLFSVKRIPSKFAIRLQPSKNGNFVDLKDFYKLTDKMIDSNSRQSTIFEQEHAPETIMPTYKVTIDDQQFFLKCFASKEDRAYEKVTLEYLAEDIFEKQKQHQILKLKGKHNIKKENCPFTINQEHQSSTVLNHSGIINGNGKVCPYLAYSKFNKDTDLEEFVEKYFTQTDEEGNKTYDTEGIKQLLFRINTMMVEFHVEGFNQKEKLEKRIQKNKILKKSNVKIKKVNYHDWVDTITLSEKSQKYLRKYFAEGLNLTQDYHSTMVHGDLHWGNLRVTENKVTTFDTERMHIGLAQEDIVKYARVKRFGIDEKEILDDYIEKYLKKRRFKPWAQDMAREGFKETYDRMYVFKLIYEIKLLKTECFNENISPERKERLGNSIKRVNNEILEHVKENIETPTSEGMHYREIKKIIDRDLSLELKDSEYIKTLSFYLSKQAYMNYIANGKQGDIEPIFKIFRELEKPETDKYRRRELVQEFLEVSKELNLGITEHHVPPELYV